MNVNAAFKGARKVVAGVERELWREGAGRGGKEG